LQFEAKENTNKHKKGDKIGVPIVKLSRNQEINIRFDVQKGIGKMHAKWSPVSLATFAPDPVIKLNETAELTMDQKIAIRNSCPTKVFEVQQGVFEVTNPEKCIFCEECIKMA
jgi:DNA-directed RNA polymerase alpha subunit